MDTTTYEARNVHYDCTCLNVARNPHCVCVCTAVKHHRPEWDPYYLGIAAAVSRRGECVRRKVGAVIVKDHTILATGYNGYPPGETKNCLTGDCPRAQSDASPGSGYAQTSCGAIHAEANAIIRAGRERCVGATIYVTAEPCVLCSPLIKASGIERIVWREVCLI